jgi:hypothetical protein
MPTYTVHIPAKAPLGDPDAFTHSEIIKDAISIPALIFSLFWFLWHRMWLVSLGIALLYIMLWTLAGLLDVHPLAVAFCQSLIGIGLALEANSLRRWTLTRHGKPMRDIVIADDVDDAEAKAAVRWLSLAQPRRINLAAPSEQLQSMTPAAAVRAASTTPIIGLFPEAGGGR